MLLDSLIECIEKLREKIEKHRISLEKSEVRTRTVLIDPLLSALGWDVSDPDQVMVEYDIEGKNVDYALSSTDYTPSAIVEAKKLGTDLTNHKMQVVNYANIHGIKYALITDGNVWELYDVFKQVQWGEKCLMSVNVATMGVPEIALKLLMLWRSNLSSSVVNPAESPIIAPISGGEVIPAGIDWIALRELNPPRGSSAPKKVKFWDNEIVVIKNWRDLFIQIVTKCYSVGSLTNQMLPIGTSKTNYVNTSNKNPNGDTMLAYHKIKNSRIYIEINLSANDSRRRSKQILRRCGYDDSAVLVSK